MKATESPNDTFKQQPGQSARAIKVLAGCGVPEEELQSESAEVCEKRHLSACKLHGMGEFSDAVALHRKNLEIRTRTLGAKAPDTLASKHGLAWALAERREVPEAEALLRDAFETAKLSYGPKNEFSLLPAQSRSLSHSLRRCR